MEEEQKVTNILEWKAKRNVTDFRKSYNELRCVFSQGIMVTEQEIENGKQFGYIDRSRLIYLGEK